MPTYTQTGRMMAIKTPLDEHALLLEVLTGTEAISELFHFELDLLAEIDTDIKFEQILGQSVTVSLLLPDGENRYFNGVVNRFSQGSQVHGSLDDSTFVRYKALVVPRLWYLTKRTQSRIFQQVDVPAILREVLAGPDVRQVLAGMDVKFELQGTYEPRDYCTQYRESDFAFASRLMQEEGIYYYFQHTDGAHTMVVADTPQSHVAVPGPTTVIYETLTGGNKPDDRVFGWVKTQEIRSGKVALWDHSFEKPTSHLDAAKMVEGTVAVGTVAHKLKVGGNEHLEQYDYPGEYAQRFDGVAPGGGDRPADVDKMLPDGRRTADIRLQQETAPGIVIVGEGLCKQFTAGHKFTLDRHFNADGEYVLTQVDHRASLVGTYTTEPADADPYVNTFRCLPIALPFRPERVTAKARVQGTQVAIVVGPSGEEIFTDKYGRVKVQFPWDRKGQNDANSSCWCRVGTVWAGNKWGAVHIPRVGMQVIVAFEEGDPDQPIIVGSVYNADQMPPYTLPDNRTQSGIKSRSTLKGTEENFNELRFEDKKDQEFIYFQAERDFDRVVQRNDTLWVGFDDKHPAQPHLRLEAGDQAATEKSQRVEIFNNQDVFVGAGKGQAADGSQKLTVWKDRTTKLETGNEKLTVAKGNRDVILDMGNDKHHLKMGNRDAQLDMGNDKVSIKMGNQETKADLGALTFEAMQSITLKVGQSKIVVDQMGVTISGMMIKVDGKLMTEVKSALMTQVSGSVMATFKGAITMIN